MWGRHKVTAVRGSDVVVAPRKEGGPYDLYSRATVGTNGEEVRAFNYGLGDVIPGTERKATLVDTNVPQGVVFHDDSLTIFEMSWHLLVPRWELGATSTASTIRKLLDQTVWEFYIGGEKPFYQCLMMATAISFGTSEQGARSLPVATHYDLDLSRVTRHGHERFYMRLLPPKLEIPLDVVFRLGCRRRRGSC